MIKSHKHSPALNSILEHKDFISESVHNVGVPIQCCKTQDIGRCWWCHHDFSGKSFQCPIRYISWQKKMIFTGRFCSDECAITWGENSAPNENVRKNCSLWFQIMKKKCIKRRPHWMHLKAYGGHLTIEEFRKNSFSYENCENFLPLAWRLYKPKKEQNILTEKYDENLWTIDKSKPIEKFTNCNVQNNYNTILSRTSKKKDHIKNVLQNFQPKKKKINK
jgi:hypothetical protein